MNLLKSRLAIAFLLSFVLLTFFSLYSVSRNFIVLTSEASELSESSQAGKEIFDEVNCLMCHLLNGEGGGLDDKAPDLAGVSSRKKSGEIKEWLKKHLYEEPRLSMFEEEPTDQDISNLTDYLQTI